MIQSRSDSAHLSVMPDLTPLLDIIFIVMVFLLLTANITVKTLTLDIPATDQAEVLQTSNTQVIAVSLLAADASWAIEETRYHDWQTFSDALLARHKQFPAHAMVIASDKTVAVQRMLQLLAFMQNNNITATNIIMDEQS